MNQFEIWKARPEGFGKAHYFVIISGMERCQNVRHVFVNGLACFTLHGVPAKVDVVLNGSDGFECPTVCPCDYFYVLTKSSLKECIGIVGFERRQQIKIRIREVFRLL